MTPGSNRPPADPSDAAIWWATRRQMSPERFHGDARFVAWLSDPRNARAWEEIDRRFELIGHFAAQPEIRRLRKSALNMVRSRQPNRRRFWITGTALAACAAGAILGPGPTTVIAPAPTTAHRLASAGNRYMTGIGERREITLPDGSRVALNTGSTLEVDYTAGRRDVRLLAGQALFHVAKDKARPFIVAAGDRLITATGTAFDVEVKRGGALAVLLVEGHVRVDAMRPQGLARVLPWLVREELEPGQRLAAMADGGAAVVTLGDVERDTAWNRGVVIFRDDRLADAISVLNRYSLQTMVIEDPEIADLRVSGVFPTARKQDFVAALEAFYPVKAHEQSPDVIALEWNSTRRP